MKVNLTHEQADFDAVASILGASLLQSDSFSILPRKLNRNVQDFVDTYVGNLPLYQFNDVPKKPISQITLVDTQSLITLKGIKKNAKIISIDHHQKKPDLPTEWEFQQIQTGAGTTYFVEQIQKKVAIQLKPIEATLLLLGIYEDTGLLTYTNTTSRDAAAVSYLLSNGANLNIASKFLNPPLSDQQQITFQDLLENAASITIDDLHIFISQSTAPELEDEVSSIAHKINDLFDLDALFIFVALKEGIRLVARSSTNQIDTAAITKTFGGGGHQRAAAALIKQTDSGEITTAELVDQFIKDLPEYITPTVTVRQIMSKKPLVLKPETTIDEARALMERFGYEGFPVLENGKIIGLLKRRAIDKAFAHRLNKTTSSLMEAGTFHVTPNDSLRHLQEIMASSGWGQIPVIDPSTTELIGIATRTDLLKELSGYEGALPTQNLAKEIKENIPSGQFRLLEIISATAADTGTPIYIVGGFVRDIILNRPSPDLDFVVEGNAIEVASRLSELFGGKVTSHKKFGTAKWWPLSDEDSGNSHSLPINKDEISHLPNSVDLISARTEFYEKPTALPTVKTSSIKLDLHRRDFTINTMAARLDGSFFGDVYDYWGGLNDLKNKSIRVLHSLSFVDDPTRMLRAVRFEQRFGFNIETRTLQLLREAIPMLDDVSGDRIRHELDQILSEENACMMMARLDDLQILSRIYPAIQWDSQLEKDFSHLNKTISSKEYTNFVNLKTRKSQLQAKFILLLFRLSPFDLQKVTSRLRFPSVTQKYLSAANSLWHTRETLLNKTPGEITEALDRFPPISILINWLAANNKTYQKMLNLFITKWQNVRIHTTGEDLRVRGIQPGPIYREILKILRVSKINNEFSSKDEEKQFLENLLEKFM